MLHPRIGCDFAHGSSRAPSPPNISISSEATLSLDNQSMKTLLSKPFRNYLRLSFLCLLALSGGAPTARAGLTMDLYLYHQTDGYYFYPWFNVNSTPPDYPLGGYVVTSPANPIAATTSVFLADTNGLNWIAGGS